MQDTGCTTCSLNTCPDLKEKQARVGSERHYTCLLSLTSLLFPCLLFSIFYCKFMGYFLNFNKGANIRGYLYGWRYNINSGDFLLLELYVCLPVFHTLSHIFVEIYIRHEVISY
ncbi:hypothetical protein Barb4_00309 [Bacteroidales bacterium Barb4]|nr:hypothetical protein Barb4_00309 [Bacteroidales bacterium Barb4]